MAKSTFRLYLHPPCGWQAWETDNLPPPRHDNCPAEGGDAVSCERVTIESADWTRDWVPTGSLRADRPCEWFNPHTDRVEYGSIPSRRRS